MIFIPTLYNFHLHVEDMLVPSCNPPMAKSNMSEEGRKKFKSPQRSIKLVNLNMTLSLYVSNVNKPRSYILMTIGHVEQTSSNYDATLSYMYVVGGCSMGSPWPTNQNYTCISLKFVLQENRATFPTLSKSTLVYENLFFRSHIKCQCFLRVMPSVAFLW